MVPPYFSVIGPFLVLLYTNDLPAALGDSAFLFADDVKMVFPRTQSSRLLLSLFSAWAWAGEWNLPINPTKFSCLTVKNLPHFLRLFPRHTPSIKFPWSPRPETWGFSLTRLSPRQCTTERLRIQQCYVFSMSVDPSANYPKNTIYPKLSKTAFIPLYCAIVQPHLAYLV